MPELTAMRDGEGDGGTLPGPRSTPVDEMAEEIAGAPAAIGATLTGLHEEHRHLVRSIGSGHVLLLGTGASLVAARCARPLWQAVDRTAGRDRSVEVVEAAEFLFGGQAARLAPPGSTVVAVSKSGISPELLAAVDVARRGAERIVAVTASADSPLARAADEVVLTPIGAENGAATKSECAALAALLALGGAVETDAASVAQLVSVVAEAVADPSRVDAGARQLAGARRAWVVGFGASNGIAEGITLLWHEKARTPAVASTPSMFRHGYVEASAAGDALIVVDADELDGLGRRYLELLEGECSRIGISIVSLSYASGGGTSIPLAGTTPPQRAIEALVRGQQLAHATAVRFGTYVDGFTILRAYVHPSASFG